MSDTPEPDPARTEREIAAALRLRPERPRVTRLSRKVLIGLGAVSAIAVSAAVFLALQSSRRESAGELYNTDNRTTPDGLANLPRDYTALPKTVPQLGPPLPGDLGRSIAHAGAPAPGMPSPAVPVDPEQQKVVQEREAARTSHLFAQSGIRQASAAAPGGTQPGPVPPANAGVDFSAVQDHKLAFANAPTDRRTVSPDRVRPPASPYVLQAGAVIPAALITGLRSDLPGQVSAQVTENVYDGPTGRILLIPQGARLLGQYDAQITFGQSRALLVWTRILMPNGRSIVLERQPGTDAEGYAGLEDEVDNHWGTLSEAAALSTILSIGAEAGSGNDSGLLQALRRGTSDSIGQTGRQLVERSLDVRPTITIRPGFPVRVLVTRDLVLEHYAS